LADNDRVAAGAAAWVMFIVRVGPLLTRTVTEPVRCPPELAVALILKEPLPVAVDGVMFESDSHDPFTDSIHWLLDVTVTCSVFALDDGCHELGDTDSVGVGG